MVAINIARPIRTDLYAPGKNLFWKNCPTTCQRMIAIAALRRIPLLSEKRCGKKTGGFLENWKITQQWKLYFNKAQFVKL